jgi:hypothetical protein
VAAYVSVPSPSDVTSTPVTDQAPAADAVAVCVTDPPALLLTTSVTVLFAGAVPLAATLVTFAAVTGSVQALMTGVATGAVPLVAVTEAVPLLLPRPSLAVAAYVTVPSPSALASMPVTDQAPPPDAVAVRVREPPPVLVRTSVTVLPAGALPAAATAVTFPLLIGLVYEVMEGAVTAAVPLVACTEVAALTFPTASVAVAVYVTVPSAREVASTPLTDQEPAPVAVAVRVTDPPPLLVIVSVTVLPAGALPPAATDSALAALMGSVQLVIVGVGTVTATEDEGVPSVPVHVGPPPSNGVTV